MLSLSNVVSLVGQNIPVIIIMTICSIIIFFLMSSLLEDDRVRNISQPSTFFSLSELTSNAWYNWLCWFFGGTLALGYVGISVFAPEIISQLKAVLLAYADFSPEVKESIEKLSSSMPSWANPLFVLIVSTLLFAPYIRKCLLTWRDVVIGVAGFYRLADHTAIDTAEDIIAKCEASYDRAEGLLLSKYHDIPIPEEYINKRDEYRIAYQLLWLNKRDINEYGIIASFNNFRDNIGLPVDKVPGVKMTMSYVFSSMLSFCVLMGLFIVLVPYASEWAKSAHYDWPDPKAQGWFSLLQSTIRNTLTYVVPTLLGLFAYPVRRRAAVSTFRKYRAQESALMSFVTIASFQWISAFVLHEIFTFLEVSWNISNGYSSSMSDAFRQIWDFTYSFIPCVTLGIFLIGQKLNINQFITSVLIVFIVGVLFSGCDFVSECARVERNNYYMFQLFFGFIVSACLFLVMFISEQPVRGLDLATPAVG